MSESGYTYLDTYRYERKFVVEGLDRDFPETAVKLHPAGFYEIYHERHINNVYLDTPRFDFYYDNVEGRHDRIKVRVRWYGDFFGEIGNPILEIKKKSGVVGTKESFKLPAFSFMSFEDIDNIKEAVTKADLPDEVRILVENLIPTLANRYRRKYFLDQTGDFRLTIDDDIEYYSILQGGVMVNEDNKVVIELKYDSGKNELLNKVVKFLPFRLTKNSKYVTGIEAFYSVVD